MFDFETKLFALAKRQNQILSDADKIFSRNSKKLRIEQYLELDVVLDKQDRTEAMPILSEYLKQLSLEENFYREYHENLISETQELAFELNKDDSDKFLTRCLERFDANNKIRLKLNREKTLAVQKMIQIVSLLNNNEHLLSETDEGYDLADDDLVDKINTIDSEIDEHLGAQYELAMLQQKMQKEGRSFLGRLLDVFRQP